MMLIYILTLFDILFVESSHFYGGTVTWKPLNNTDTNSQISIMFTQSYQWRLSYAASYCNESYILNQSPKIPVDISKLQCITTPSSSCGGYIPLNVTEYCTDFSTFIDSSSGQISEVRNITVGSKFCVAYQSSAWIGLQINCGTSGTTTSNSSTIATTTIPTCLTTGVAWSIGCCVDLSIRPDGIINTPPVATIMSPINVPVNNLINVPIPVIDADNDVVRCRWAVKTSSVDECGGVCGIASGSTLDSDNCTLTFDSTGKTIGNYYPIALMVEDFYNESTNTSFSSIPIQLLIKIIAQPSCPTKPVISSGLSMYTTVEVGIEFNFTLTLTQGCFGTTISDFFRMPPLYMYKGDIVQVGSSNVWTVTETWIPTTDQLGSQVYCSIATDSANVRSNQYCLTFTVIPYSIMNSTTIETTTVSIQLEQTVSSTDSSGLNKLGIGLGLGLGLPLLLLLSALALYSCCCQKYPLLSRYFNRSRNNDNPPKSNQNLTDYEKDNKYFHNQLPNYRQQYINDNCNSHTIDQSNESNNMRLLTQESAFTSMSSSDFETNYMNTTRTSLFSPSVISLPNVDVQSTTNRTSKNINSSILMRAYSVQETRKSFYLP